MPPCLSVHRINELLGVCGWTFYSVGLFAASSGKSASVLEALALLESPSICCHHKTIYYTTQTDLHKPFVAGPDVSIYNAKDP